MWTFQYFNSPDALSTFNSYKGTQANAMGMGYFVVYLFILLSMKITVTWCDSTVKLTKRSTGDNDSLILKREDGLFLKTMTLMVLLVSPAL